MLLLTVVSISTYTDSLQAVYSLLHLPAFSVFTDRKMQTRLGRLFARLFYVFLLSAFAAAAQFPGSDLPVLLSPAINRRGLSHYPPLVCS